MPGPDANLQLVMFLCYLTNAGLSALLVWSGRPFPGAWLWVLAQALLALGTLSDTLPPSVPPWLPLVVGNTAYTSASLAFIHSVWLFQFKTRFPRALYLIIVVQLVSFALALGQPYWVRAVVFSAWMTLGPLTTGGLLLKSVDRHSLLAHGLTALPFFALGTASLIRVGLLLASVVQGATDQLGPLNVWYVSGAILLSNIILFGYFMLTRTRGEQILNQKDDEIEARNRRLVESVRTKDLFFSIVAHDLRGPIGGAARYVRKHLLAKMTGLEAKFAEVETLASALEKTNEFLEKLLWWSRAQQQDWLPARQTVDLAVALEQAVASVRSAAKLKEIAVDIVPGAYPEPVADPESVQLIIGNLLTNAVKFSLPGHRVKVEVEEVEGLCRITVEDQGIGMDQATLDRLFRIEDKLTTHGTSGERGSGMGLLLAQSLAERNRGGIVVDSEPGIGTRATLWLPTRNL